MELELDIYCRIKIDVNSGAKAYANLLRSSKGSKTYTQGYSTISQTRITLLGVVTALEGVQFAAQIKIYSTAKYVKSTCEKGWVERWNNNSWLKSDGNPPLNVDLWKRLHKQLDLHQVEFIDVTSYTDYQELVYCKKQAQIRLEQGDLLQDQVYLNYLKELNAESKNPVDLPVELSAFDLMQTPVQRESAQTLDQYKQDNKPCKDVVEQDLDDVEDFKITLLPYDVKLLLLIKACVSNYFYDQPTMVQLRSTDLYDQILKDITLKTHFPHAVVFNRFLRKQHQQGILMQIIPNCKVDTFDENFYQWYFHQ